jgi:hypothetical protein
MCVITITVLCYYFTLYEVCSSLISLVYDISVSSHEWLHNVFVYLVLGP